MNDLLKIQVEVSKSRFDAGMEGLGKMKVAITGTSKGLGLALARKLQNTGHEVAGGARSELTAPGFAYKQLDVTDESSQEAWWTWVVEEFAGLPDILVANAAIINRSVSLWEVPSDEFRALVDINITGVFLSFKCFMSRWQAGAERKPATLIGLSSGWGRSTSPQVAPYCASKWAIEGMVKALAQELPDQVSAVALNPGIIDTDMLQSCFGESASFHEKPEQWAERAAPYILSLGRSHNGASATVP